MMNPYQVLGISRGASDDEIKRAYRNLSRKYHPYAHVNNPNKELAEEKFKEAQQAYAQIMKEKQTGSADGSYTYSRYTNYSGGGAENTYEEASSYMQAAVNLLRSRNYRMAMQMLDKVPFSERNGRWYYFCAIANQGMGNLATAMEMIDKAVSLEPSNREYREFQQNLSFGGTWYTHMGGAYERPYSRYDHFCLSLFCMQMFCNCCCRPC